MVNNLFTDRSNQALDQTVSEISAILAAGYLRHRAGKQGRSGGVHSRRHAKGCPLPEMELNTEEIPPPTCPDPFTENTLDHPAPQSVHGVVG